MVEKEKTFSEIYKTFLLNQETNNQDSFTEACYIWLLFEPTRVQTTRLSILYILYTHYSKLPLDQNPFLTFFLELFDLPQPFSAIEHHFVYCILEETLPILDNLTPQDICNELPVAIQKNKAQIDFLRQKVARLIDNPDLIVLNENIFVLISNASQRILTLSENEILRKEILSNYPLTNYINPNQLNYLIDLNQFLALEIVPLLLKSDLSNLYLQALLNSHVTINSLEVIHHVLVNNMTLSQEFLHYYISNSIRSCDKLEEGLLKDRQVKQVARFIQSLLEKQIISMRDYFVEIQSFCTSYMKLKGVANLFRLATIADLYQIN